MLKPIQESLIKEVAKLIHDLEKIIKEAKPEERAELEKILADLKKIIGG